MVRSQTLNSTNSKGITILKNNTPEKNVKKRPSLSTVWTEAKDLLAANRQRLIFGLLLMLVSRVAGLVLPATSKYLIDDVMVNKRDDLLLWLALAAGGATLIQALTSFTLSQLLGVAAHRAINDLRVSTQAHILKLPVRFFDSTQSGALISRIMTDAEGIRNLVGNGIVQLIGGLVTAALALGVLFYLNWHLTLIILIILLIFGICMAFAFSRLRPVFRERGKINAEVTGRLSESLGGIRVVKAYVAEASEKNVFAAGVGRIFKNVSTSITGVSAMTAVSTILLGVVGVIMILVGGQAMTDGSMSPGDFIMYVFFVGLVAAPVMEIASIGTQITEAFAGLDRIREIRRMVAEDDGDETRASCKELRGDVAFKDVSFEYEPNKPVLKNISFLTPAGTTTALVGSSGSGKSTLVGLVMAFQRPLSGMICVDGQDLASLKLGHYRSHLGVVLQDNFLFDGTVADNIKFSRPDATLEAIREVSRIAHCEEFILEFEKGYDTLVGERGVRLSGGQRQRIAIARALLAQPKILILDEATSSLDSESEAKIQAGLQALRRGRTTFVIAHRLSTIRSADQILVLEAGEIVERGTHEILLELNGRYRQLYDKQYHFEHERFINPGEDFTPKLVLK
jgi:subfamily B ATP-binding cassette protein MsbA